ncbi:MAG: helix-turn-helix transcriptional regulator [Chthoniobacterales bacterium]
MHQSPKPEDHRAVAPSAWRRRLLDSTRGRLLETLREGERTVNQLAAALNLTDNAVRAHLLSLERDGLIIQSGTQAGFRKPHATYALTAEAEQIFPKAYGPLLDVILTVFSKKLTPAELRAALREVGRTIASKHLPQLAAKDREARIDAALALLKEMGGAAQFHETEGKHFIRGEGCPLAAATSRHPEACLIAESLLAQIIGVRVTERCQHGPSPSCRFELKK